MDKHRTILDRLLVSLIYLADLHSVTLVPTVCTCHMRDFLYYRHPGLSGHRTSSLDQSTWTCDFCWLSNLYTYLLQQAKTHL